MRTFLISILCLVCSVAYAQNEVSAPGWALKAQKSIVSVLAYDAQNNLIGSGTGFYVNSSGEAITNYTIMRGAYKAVVVDAGGKQYDVDRILGADDTYSIVRFTVNTKKSQPLNMAAQPQGKGASLYAIDFSKEKRKTCPVATVADTAMIDGTTPYYTLAGEIDQRYVGAPVFNNDGQLVGMLQSRVAGKDYVLGIEYAKQVAIRAISSRTSQIALDNIHIHKGLPDNQEESLVYLYFKSRNTSNDEYLDMLNLFIQTYPKNAEGYYRRATPLTDLLRFDEANNDLQTYLKLSTDKAVAYSNIAQSIHSKLVYQPEPAYDKWTYDVALDYIDKALALDPKLDNRLLKSQILMSKKDYDGALAIYDDIIASDQRSPGIYFAACLAHEGRGDSTSVQIELLDSAIAMMGEPMPREAANYVMRRAQLHSQSGNVRAAINDYNKYCFLQNNQVTHQFYFDREQLELRARMYQQAIDDIDKAIQLAPREPIYYVEKSALMLRVNELDESIKAAQQCLAISPDNPDAYRIMGYAQLQQGKKSDAQRNLEKAVELGDETAKQIIDKYLK